MIHDEQLSASIAEDVKRIKALSWSNTKGRAKDKFISVGKVIESCRVQTNFEEIAIKCSENPNHEHFGKAPAEITAIWQNKSNTGANRGSTLDSYIHHILHGKDFVPVDEIDEIMQSKMNVFDKLNSEILQKFCMIPCVDELWVTSKTGVRGKLDELFYLKTENSGSYVVADWKNTEEIRTFNVNQKMLGPLAHLDDCELVRYYLQVDIYCYILLNEFNIPAYAARVFQIKAENYKIQKRPFPYNDGMIKSLIEYATKSIN